VIKFLAFYLAAILKQFSGYASILNASAAGTYGKKAHLSGLF
jgi:hypothetical protein